MIEHITVVANAAILHQNEDAIAADHFDRLGLCLVF